MSRLLHDWPVWDSKSEYKSAPKAPASFVKGYSVICGVVENWQTTYSFLSDLNNDEDDWMITIRVCRVWESVNAKKNGELISMYMIFIDEKANLMHATIRKISVSKFMHLLSEGSLYSVNNFKVVASTGQYRPLSNDHKIIFLVSTKLKRLEEGMMNIPINEFQFISPNLIDLRVNDSTILSDVFGCLCAVGDVEIVGGGEVSFSTTSASKIYIHLQIDYVTSLIERFSTISNGVKTIASSNMNKTTLEEDMFVNRMTIQELLQADWSGELKEYIVTLSRKIIEIDNSFGWYKIHIKVIDKTANTTLVLFNVVAENLLDTSVHKLFNELSSNNNDVPAEIQSLCEKDFVYKLRLNDYNLKEGLENFTVSKVFMPDEKLEQQHQLKKGKNKDPHNANDLEDSDGDYHKKKKRRNQMVDDHDEVSDDGNTQ
ncbi:uncharacterized protein LOC133791832 [Humulus lupulus]|uniref:uncharacterized protein LOC133791832 n=1 Tax=Humulus lupulus TaxID=3486 RepID=UPI002B4005E0|nr:uncharacterized protein LOC133791832 [Humulus lupulus]